MTDSLQSTERLAALDDARPRVVVVDRDPRRLLGLSRAFAERGFTASLHLSHGAFWVAVPRTRPTVLVLEVVAPLMSAVRTVSLVTEILGRRPAVVLYGWVPAAALARLAVDLPGALCLSSDEGPAAVAEAVERAHVALLDEGRPSAPVAATRRSRR